MARDTFGSVTTTSARRWIEAARVLAAEKSAVVTCPERGDGRLTVHDEVSDNDPTMMERYLVCDTCGARNVIRMRVGPLADLRARLDRVRAAPSDANVREVSGSERTDVLIGMTRAQVRAALGEPQICEDDFFGRGCRTRGDWFYSFYHLPRGSRGGGPDLLLRFDGSDTCIRAEWRFSR